jgi:uncharacterized protein (TIGR03435 family)
MLTHPFVCRFVELLVPSAVWLVALAPGQRGSTATQPGVAFEVASVRLDTRRFPAEAGVTIEARPGGRFEANNVLVLHLIQYAYNLNASRIKDAPEWARKERFDVEAKLPDSAVDPNGDLTKVALKQLLADRFRLALVEETPIIEVLELTRMQNKRPAGLRLSPPECQVTPTSGGSSNCAGAILRMSETHLSLTASDLAPLLIRLSSATGRPVVDRTGLTGLYDIDLRWSEGPDGPSLVSAVQEQLGLKLVPARSPQRILRIAHIEKLSSGRQ